jgi:carotenoid cleavage dioxygenase-like enzyme
MEANMTKQTQTSNGADSTGAKYLEGVLAPLADEVTAFDLEVIGQIPEALNGRFLRMGRR